MPLNFILNLLGLGPSAPNRIDINQSGAGLGLPIVFGERKVKPIPVFKAVSDDNAEIAVGGTGGADSVFWSGSRGADEGKDKRHKHNNWLYVVEALAHGPVNRVAAHYVDGDHATHARFKDGPYIRFDEYYGRPGQTAHAPLVGATRRWTMAHRGENCAYVVSRYYNSGNKPQFRSEPRHEVVVQGAHLYDPRQDSSRGGAGAQRADDPATWVYGTNRALAVLTYMLADYGVAIPPDKIDMASFAMAASFCDGSADIPDVRYNENSEIELVFDPVSGEEVEVYPGLRYPSYRPYQAAGSTTQKRQVVDIVLSPSSTVVDNTKKLLEGVGWSLPWSNGQHKLILETEGLSPVMAFDETSIISMGRAQRGDRRKRLNRVTVEFNNRNKDFEADTVSWPKRGSLTHTDLLAEDFGEELHATRKAETITDFYRAEDWAELLVRRSRADLRIEGLQVMAKGMLLEPGDIVTVDLPDRGFNTQAFLVEAVKVSPWLEVSLDLLVYDEGVYSAAQREQEPVSGGSGGEFDWRSPTPVTGFVAAQFHERKLDGATISGFDLSWDLPEAPAGVRAIVVKWRKSNEADFNETLYLPSNGRLARVRGLEDGASYDFQIRYSTHLGQLSPPFEELGVALENARDFLGIQSPHQVDFRFDVVRSFRGEEVYDHWDGDNMTLSPQGSGMVIEGTGGGEAVLRLTGVSLRGEDADQVHLVIQRFGGGDYSFEPISLHWATESHGVSAANQVVGPARISSAGFSIFPFDASRPSHGALDDWTSAAKVQDIELRFGALAPGDRFYIPAIRFGRLTLDPEGRGAGDTLIPGEIATQLVPDNDRANRTYAVIHLQQLGVQAGTVLECSALQRAQTPRGARLLARFRDSENTILSDFVSSWTRNQSVLEEAVIANVTVPANAHRLALLLDGEEGLTGAIEGRAPVVKVVRRPDVERQATSNLVIQPYDGASADYALGDQVSDSGDSFVYVAEASGQVAALSDGAVWKRNRDVSEAPDGLLRGFGAPDAALGSDDQYYFDKGSNLLYRKQFGIWLLWTPIRRNVGALAANDSATTDLIAFRAVTEQGAITRANFRMGAVSPVEAVSTSIPIADEFAGEPVLARVSCIAEVTIDSGSPSALMSLTVGSETIDLNTGRLSGVGTTQQMSITRYYTPTAGTFTVDGTMDIGGGQIEIQAFTAEAVLFKR